MALSAVMLCVSIPMTAFTAHAESDSNHVHDESCYRKKLHCLHEHDDSCYEGDETATSSNMKKLVCDHEHGEGCYEVVLDCGYRQEENSSEGAEGIETPEQIRMAVLQAWHPRQQQRGH